MRWAHRATWALALAAYVAWFGGLLRLLAEAVARLLPQVAPTESDRTGLAFATIGSGVVLVIVIALLYRWHWYRGVLRQTREDVYGSHGLPVPPFGQIVQRVLRWLAFFVPPAVVLAFLLPGPAAAAIAMVVGLVLRVVAVVVVASAPST